MFFVNILIFFQMFLYISHVPSYSSSVYLLSSFAKFLHRSYFNLELSYRQTLLNYNNIFSWLKGLYTLFHPLNYRLACHIYNSTTKL